MKFENFKTSGKVFFIALIFLMLSLFTVPLIMAIPLIVSGRADVIGVTVFLLCGSLFFGAVLYQLVVILIKPESSNVQQSSEPKSSVTMGELGELLAALDGEPDGTFIVLILSDQNKPDQEMMNIQYSIEKGVVGLDWVLISPGNMKRADKFRRLIRSLGLHIEEREMNGVSYLRVEDTNLEVLGKQVLQEFGARADTELDTVYS